MAVWPIVPSIRIIGRIVGVVIVVAVSTGVIGCIVGVVIVVAIPMGDETV